MGGRPGRYPGVEARKNTIRLTVPVDGQRRRGTLDLPPTPANLQYAARLREEMRQKAKAGILRWADYFPDDDPDTSPTFGALARQWMAANPHWATATRQGYQKILDRYWLPRLDDRPIDQITYGELAELIAAQGFNSEKTRNNAVSVLRKVFELAHLDGWIETNPAARLKNTPAQRPPPDPVTLEEADKILDWIGRHRGEPERNYFELAFFTGLRPSELIALRWPDIDFRYSLLRVQRAQVRKETKGTKTHSVRDVELNSRALAALQRQKAHTYLQGGHVFLDRQGKPYNDDKPPRRVWDAALKGLGIRHRVAYQTRHTFATLNLMAGANPMWVARQMGHTSMKMVLERYGRWIDQADRSRELGKLESMLGGGSGGENGGPQGHTGE